MTNPKRSPPFPLLSFPFLSFVPKATTFVDFKAPESVQAAMAEHGAGLEIGGKKVKLEEKRDKSRSGSGGSGRRGPPRPQPNGRAHDHAA